MRLVIQDGNTIDYWVVRDRDAQSHIVATFADRADADEFVARKSTPKENDGSKDCPIGQDDSRTGLLKRLALLQETFEDERAKWSNSLASARRAAMQAAADRLRKIASENTEVEYTRDFNAGWDAAVDWLDDFGKDGI